MRPEITQPDRPDAPGDRRQPRSHRRSALGRRHLRPKWVERLEERTLLSTFSVTNNSDALNPDGSPFVGSLRAAIVQVNNDTSNPATDTIAFAIPGAGVHTIQPLSQFPIVAHPVIIDGYSQAGSKPNDLAVGDDATLSIELDGSNAGKAVGLWISAGIVERHQGRLRVRSSDNPARHGTVFTLFLPCKEIET